MNSKLVVLFEKDQSTLEMTRVEKIMLRLQNQLINNVIIILNGDPNNAKVVEKKAKAKIDEINALKHYSLELFNLDDLVFDITKHELVPQHIPINDEEKKVHYFIITIL